MSEHGPGERHFNEAPDGSLYLADWECICGNGRWFAGSGCDSKPVGCGGCMGLGSHSRECRKNPEYTYVRVLASRAKSLADEIGSNCPEAANLVYLAQFALLRKHEDTLDH